MAWGAILAGLLSAGGQAAGGIVGAKEGKTRASDLVSANYNPSLDYALQAQNYDALSQIGFGNLNNIPGPFKQLTGQIENIPLDAKTRRRALSALYSVQQDPSLLNDPYGRNFSQQDVANAFYNGAPTGRAVAQVGSPGSGDAWGLPIKSLGRLDQALNATGMNLSDLQKTLQQQKEFDAQIQRYKDAGLPQLAEQMVIDRAKTTSSAAGIAAAGADYAKTGETTNPLFQQLQAQDSRNLDRFATRAGLQANFGGISQAAAQKQISDAQLDQNLRVLQNALSTSGLLQATLTPGTQAAQGTTSGQSNSAQIAAQQAAAANSIRQGSNQYVGDSIGNAIGSSTSTLGSALSNYSLYNQLGLYKQNNPSNSININAGTLFGAAG